MARNKGPRKDQWYTAEFELKAVKLRGVGLQSALRVPAAIAPEAAGTQVRHAILRPPRGLGMTTVMEIACSTRQEFLPAAAAPPPLGLSQGARAARAGV